MYICLWGQQYYVRTQAISRSRISPRRINSVTHQGRQSKERMCSFFLLWMKCVIRVRLTLLM